MAEAHEELLNYYDAEGCVLGIAPRAQAKASGHAVGAVNALILGRDGRVLLQRRPRDVENGGLWDKSVGGHVSAGEDFDATIVRETGEELFGSAPSPHVVLASGPAQVEISTRDDLVWLRRVALQKNLRDVRRTPGGAGLRNVTYHVAIYLGRTELALERFTPQRSEIDELAYWSPADIDALLVRGELAPNMSFLWLTQAHALLGASERMPFTTDDVRRALQARPGQPSAAVVSSRAAVALILRPCASGLEVLLIRRALHPRDPWSGQMAFPGGRAELRDESLSATATREVAEEIGLDLGRDAELLGALDEVQALARMRPMDLTIQPFVFSLHGPGEAYVREEVDSVHWLPLEGLLCEAARGIHKRRYGGQVQRFPCLRLDGLMIWGLTYRMLLDLDARLRDGTQG